MPMEGVLCRGRIQSKSTAVVRMQLAGWRCHLSRPSCVGEFSSRYTELVWNGYKIITFVILNIMFLRRLPQFIQYL